MKTGTANAGRSLAGAEVRVDIAEFEARLKVVLGYNAVRSRPHSVRLRGLGSPRDSRLGSWRYFAQFEFFRSALQQPEAHIFVIDQLVTLACRIFEPGAIGDFDMPARIFD